MGNKPSNESHRNVYQQPWPSTQGAAESNQPTTSLPQSMPLSRPAVQPEHIDQQIHQPVNDQPLGSFSSNPSRTSQPDHTVQSRRADDRAGQPFNAPQAGSEQHQIIPIWLSEPRPLLRSDPTLPALTARGTPRRRKNDYVTLPIQRTPAIEEQQRQTVPLQLSVPPAVPIARQSSFNERSAESFNEATIRPGPAVPFDASAPRRIAVGTVDALLTLSEVEGSALPQPLLPLRDATPPLLPLRQRKTLSRHRKPPAQLPRHRWKGRPLLGGGSCDADAPANVSRSCVPASSSPRQQQGTPAIGAAASTSYGLRRSPGVLNVPDILRKSPAAAPKVLAAVRKCSKDYHHRSPESDCAQRTSPASISAPRSSMHDASSSAKDSRGFHSAHDGRTGQHRHDKSEDDERLGRVIIRDWLLSPPPLVSGEALESCGRDKLGRAKVPSAKSGQSHPLSTAPGFEGEGGACTAKSSRFISGSSLGASAASFGDPVSGALSADKGARAKRRRSRRPAGEDVRHDSPASSSVPSKSMHDMSTTGADKLGPHRKSHEARDGRAERRIHFKVSDQELLARVALRQRSWRPPPLLSGEALESYVWAKLGPSQSRSANRDHSSPGRVLDALGFGGSREAQAAASSRCGGLSSSRRAAFSGSGGLSDGYYADTEEDDERRRERSRFEQESYDAELSQRFAAAAAVATAPRATFGLFLDSAHVRVGAPISSSAGAAWTSAEAAQNSTRSEAATTSASSRSTLPQAGASLVGSRGTTGGNNVAGLPICGRLLPQARYYTSQPKVPK